MWGVTTLRKMQGAGDAAPTNRNRFADVALVWAAALLSGACDSSRSSMDLFTRDHMVLGKLLMTLGMFCRCARLTPAAVPLAGACLELFLVRLLSEVHESLASCS